MSKRQRPSLKGRGSAIFFSEDESEHDREAKSEPTDTVEGTRDTSATENTADEMRYSGEMKKLTFNLPLELAFALDEIQLDIRRATRSGVTKTEIVQAALERTFREFQEGGDESQLLDDLGFEALRTGSTPSDSVDT